MKTLDEVIDELEDEGLFADALHYLREYKAHQADWSYAVANSEQFAEARDKHIKALADLKRNDPLTWGDLTQMIGKPVWVIDANNKGRWYLVKAIDEEAIFTDFFGNSGIGYPKDFGKTWQAYRKERDHGLVQ